MGRKTETKKKNKPAMPACCGGAVYVAVLATWGLCQRQCDLDQDCRGAVYNGTACYKCNAGIACRAPWAVYEKSAETGGCVQTACIACPAFPSLRAFVETPNASLVLSDHCRHTAASNGTIAGDMDVLPVGPGQSIRGAGAVLLGNVSVIEVRGSNVRLTGFAFEGVVAIGVPSVSNVHIEGVVSTVSAIAVRVVPTHMNPVLHVADMVVAGSHGTRDSVAAALVTGSLTVRCAAGYGVVIQMLSGTDFESAGCVVHDVGALLSIAGTEYEIMYNHEGEYEEADYNGRWIYITAGVLFVTLLYTHPWLFVHATNAR